MISRHNTCPLLLAAGIASASASASAEPSTCTLGELTRTVEVEYANPGQAVPCEVIYSKLAQATVETLWRANNEAGYCETQAAGLIARLESLGWACAGTAGDAPEAPQDAARPPG